MPAEATATRTAVRACSVRDRALGTLGGAAVVVIGGWLRLRDLGWTRFTSDQANFLGAVRNLVRYAHWPTLGPDIGPGFWQWGHLGPPHFYLAAPAFWLGDGLPEAQVVFLAALHLVGLVALIRVGNRFIGPHAGLLAGLLFAVAPYPVFVAREVVNFAFVPPVVALMVLAVLEASVEGRIGGLAVALPSVAFLVQVHASSWALAPLPVLAILGARGRWRALIGWGSLGSLAALVVLGPYLWGQLHDGFRDFMLFLHAAGGGQASTPEIPFPNLEGLRFAFHSLDALPHDPYVATPGGPSTAVLAAALVMLGAGLGGVSLIRAVRARHVGADAARDLVLLYAFFSAPLLLMRFGHEIYHRHVIASGPVAALLAARGLAWWWSRSPRARPLSIAVAVLVATGLGTHTFRYQQAVIDGERIAGGIPLAIQSDLARALTVTGGLRWDSSERLRMPGLEDSRYGVRYLVEEYAAHTVSELAHPPRPALSFTVFDRAWGATEEAAGTRLQLVPGGRYPIIASRSVLLSDPVDLRLDGQMPWRTGLPWSGRTTSEHAELRVRGALGTTDTRSPSTWIVTSNGCVDGIWLDDQRVHASHCSGAPAALPWPRAEGFVLPSGSGTLRLALRHRGPELWIDLCELPFAPPQDPTAPSAVAHWGDIPIHRPDVSGSGSRPRDTDDRRFLR